MVKRMEEGDWISPEDVSHIVAIFKKNFLMSLGNGLYANIGIGTIITPKAVLSSSSVADSDSDIYIVGGAHLQSSLKTTIDGENERDKRSSTGNEKYYIDKIVRHPEHNIALYFLEKIIPVWLPLFKSIKLHTTMIPDCSHVDIYAWNYKVEAIRKSDIIVNLSDDCHMNSAHVRQVTPYNKAYSSFQGYNAVLNLEDGDRGLGVYVNNSIAGIATDFKAHQSSASISFANISYFANWIESVVGGSQPNLMLFNHQILVISIVLSSFHLIK